MRKWLNGMQEQMNQISATEAAASENAEKWEYKVVTGRHALDEGHLNSLGRAGWELVAACGSAMTTTVYLKRRR